jgi:hypothetical protein
VSTYTGIVKPQYRLLGMLMERRDLRARLLNHTVWYAGAAQTDSMRLALERRLALLDSEICEHQAQVTAHYQAAGRSLDELTDFIGEDLMDELAAIVDPALSELSS